MTQNTPLLSNWLVTDDDRAKAQLKYELKHLENRFAKYLEVYNHAEYCPDEVISLSSVLAQRYVDYLKLLHVPISPQMSDISDSLTIFNWIEVIPLITGLKQKLSRSVDLQEQAGLIKQIASAYYQCSHLLGSVTVNRDSVCRSKKNPDELNLVFRKNNLESWLMGLISLWNQKDDLYTEPNLVFNNWTLDQQQQALDFFSKAELVNLVNAIFFYKLNPDKLFNDLIHPEKLVSVRMRLGFLHEYIELLQRSLYSIAIRNGLKRGVDYLFHGDDIPQGIMIEVNEEYQMLIQSAIKNIKVQYTFENEERVTIERLHDLGRAYKFWFNPNRLIDAVMILQQLLVTEDVNEENNLDVFRQKMVGLYGQLTTTECLDLYGYFANNDSRYLLYTLFVIDHDKPLDWLPPLKSIEKAAIHRIFLALQCVMEALRVELKNRHVNTEPYVYDLAKQFVQAGRRNRDAVFRIIAIYGRENITISDAVEKLFSFMEEPVKAIKPATELEG